MWSTASETGITFQAERRDSWKYACIHGLAIYKHDWGVELGTILGNKSRYSRGQYAEYGKWTHKPFLKAYCIHQNHRIERGSVGPKRFAPDLQGHSHDIFCQIYHNLSVLPHHFHIPFLHFCFLIRMVRLYTNTRTGNLSVIFFVALLLSELNGEEWTY